MTLEHRAPAIDSSGPDAGRDILLEGLVEGVALATVEGEDRAVLGEPAKGRASHTGRNTGGLRFRRHAGEEAVEVAAAAGGECGRGERKGNEQDADRAHKEKH